MLSGAVAGFAVLVSSTALPTVLATGVWFVFRGGGGGGGGGVDRALIVAEDRADEGDIAQK